jgi:hypothetical protein
MLVLQILVSFAGKVDTTSFEAQTNINLQSQVRVDMATNERPRQDRAQ